MLLKNIHLYVGLKYLNIFLFNRRKYTTFFNTTLTFFMFFSHLHTSFPIKPFVFISHYVA